MSGRRPMIATAALAAVALGPAPAPAAAAEMPLHPFAAGLTFN
jgi:hypothetical protein